MFNIHVHWLHTSATGVSLEDCQAKPNANLTKNYSFTKIKIARQDNNEDRSLIVYFWQILEKVRIIFITTYIVIM